MHTQPLQHVNITAQLGDVPASSPPAQTDGRVENKKLLSFACNELAGPVTGQRDDVGLLLEHRDATVKGAT